MAAHTATRSARMSLSFSITLIVPAIVWARKRFAPNFNFRPTRNMRLSCILTALALTFMPAGQAHANCWEISAAKYGIDPYLLAAIARVESSFNPKALNRNKNGTEDIGIMQINTLVLKEVSRFGITREQLFDPCINIDVAAWKLASHFRDYGVSWYAVGAYHSKTPTFNKVYQLKVYLAFLNLTGSSHMRGQ